MLSRLEKALEMAERFPDAKLILSGGDVKTEFTEAAVMKEWLVEQGIEETRLLLDEEARDTHGNAARAAGLFAHADYSRTLRFA